MVWAGSTILCFLFIYTLTIMVDIMMVIYVWYISRSHRWIESAILMKRNGSEVVLELRVVDTALVEK